MESLRELEKEISQKISDYYEKELGLRPSGVHTAIQGDLILIRFENVLSPSEIDLITQESGKRLIKEMHERLARQILPGLQTILRHLAATEAVALDIELLERSRGKIFLITIETPLVAPPSREDL